MEEKQRVYVTRVQKVNKGGRQPRLTDDQIDVLVTYYNQGVTQRELSEKYGISLSTVKKYLRERRLPQGQEDKEVNGNE